MPSNDNTTVAMPWWGWIAAIFAGFFLCNTIPHTFMGVTGQEFPTALSGGPPNTSSAMVNAVYGFVNLGIGLLLARSIRRWLGNFAVQITIYIAALAFAVLLAWSFSTMM